MKKPTAAQSKKIEAVALREIENELRLRGYPIPALKEDRPFEVYFYSERTVRFRSRTPKRDGILQFSCTYAEACAPEVLNWVVDVYDAHVREVAPPDPPVPVTTHWKSGQHPCCYYLWSLAGLDAYVKDRGPGADSALAPYDPRRNQKPATTEESTT